MSNSLETEKSTKSDQVEKKDQMPAAGPHAKPELTDFEKTPGTGSLPDKTTHEGDIGPD
jgi:hypothetical protein